MHFVIVEDNLQRHVCYQVGQTLVASLVTLQVPFGNDKCGGLLPRQRLQLNNRLVQPQQILQMLQLDALRLLQQLGKISIAQFTLSVVQFAHAQ